MNKIDFVLPWVDPNDINWQKNKNQYNDLTIGEHNSTARYRDMDTLKYVLRSIEKNCPWYNKIHLITCGHSPEWLDINHPRVNLITHKELYFDKSHLPVFSSSSIEMNLATMKDVTEKIVYLNDDMIIVNKVGIERFFQEGKPVDFLSHGWLPRNKLFEKLKGINTWIQALNNNLTLINKKFSPLKFEKKYLYHPTYIFKNKFSNFLLQYIYKKFIWIEHWHHPQHYLMTTLKVVDNAFHKEMMTCSANRFRANNDLTQYIYRYWQLANSEFFPHKYDDAFANSISSTKILQKALNKIDVNNNINFVCFNDSEHLSDIEYAEVKRMMTDYLESKFPEKASFEKSF